jgi:hypothetical protein
MGVLVLCGHGFSFSLDVTPGGSQRGHYVFQSPHAAAMCFYAWWAFCPFAVSFEAQPFGEGVEFLCLIIH